MARHPVLQAADPRRAGAAIEGPVQQAAYQGLGGKGGRVRCVRFRHTRIQPRHLGCTKNAIDYLYREWNNKAAGFVSYGSAGGARAVEHLRLVMAELQVATVRAQVLLSLFTDFENFSALKPVAHHEQTVGAMLDQLIAWAAALKALRSGQIAHRRAA